MTETASSAQARDQAVPPGLALVLPAGLAVAPLRITSSAKMTALIAFALAHLADPTNAPLAIHSLSPAAVAASAHSGPATSTPVIATAPPPAPDPASTPLPPKASSSSSAAVLPKLVSVVEIIKRSFIPPTSPSDATAPVPAVEDNGKGKGRAMEAPAGGNAAGGDAQRPAKGKGQAVAGVHQYSHLGALEELGLAGPGAEGEDGEAGEEARQDQVALDWIKSGGGGTKRPKRKHTPYMVVILSSTLIPSLSESGFTYQPPASPAKPTKRTTGSIQEGTGEAQPEKKKRKRKPKKKAGVVDGDDNAEGSAMDVSVTVP
ncbi:hypothetical protein RQP46_005003 [Phenoliferia psychrophenolica]